MIDHLTDADLLTRIWGKLASGELPRQGPRATFGGPSTGQRCSACDESIATPEAEIEVHSADDKRRFYHPRCFNLLTMERTHRQN